MAPLRSSNGRLLVEHGSDRHETLPKRVLDHPVESIFGPTNFVSPRFFGLENRFTPFWSNFGGSTEKRTSTANSSQFFALDAPILRPVRPKIVGNMSVGALGSEMYRSNPPCPQPHHMVQGNFPTVRSKHFCPSKLILQRFTGFPVVWRQL